jgi:hypothetical protein
MLLLAQMPEPSTYQAIGWLAMTVAAAAVGFNAIKKAVTGLKDKPSPAELQADAADRYQPLGDYATHSDLARIQAEIKEDRKLAQASRERVDNEIKAVQRDLGEMERRLNEGSEKRAKETHDRINLVLEAVAELRGEVHAR